MADDKEQSHKLANEEIKWKKTKFNNGEALKLYKGSNAN